MVIQNSNQQNGVPFKEIILPFNSKIVQFDGQILYVGNKIHYVIYLYHIDFEFCFAVEKFEDFENLMDSGRKRSRAIGTCQFFESGL